MLKILIAEDDYELRQLFSHVLVKNGYAVKADNLLVAKNYTCVGFVYSFKIAVHRFVSAA